VLEKNHQLLEDTTIYYNISRMNFKEDDVAPGKQMAGRRRTYTSMIAHEEDGHIVRTLLI
jgi:hypothetical protein